MTKTQRYAVLIKRPESSELMGLSRTAKYNYLKTYASHVKDGILSWLKEKNLLNQVRSVEPITAFNTIIFDTTEQVSNELKHNNEVIEVSEDQDVPVVLTWKDYEQL